MFRPRSTSAGGWAGAEVTEKLILFTDKIIQDFIYRQDWTGIEKNPQSQQPRNMVFFSAANRLIGEVVQSLLGPSPGCKQLLALSHLRHY